MPCDPGELTPRQPISMRGYEQCTMPPRAVKPHTTCEADPKERYMSITKLTPVWAAQGRETHAHDVHYVRPYVPPPRIIVGLLTGDGPEGTPVTKQPVVRDRR